MQPSEAGLELVLDFTADGMEPLSASLPLPAADASRDWKALILDSTSEAMEGRNEQAADLLVRAAALAKDDPRALNACAHLLLELDDPKSRRPEEALALAECAATLLGQEDAEVLDTQAAALFELGRLQEAVELQERSLALKKDKARADLESQRLENPDSFTEKAVQLMNEDIDRMRDETLERYRAALQTSRQAVEEEGL